MRLLHLSVYFAAAGDDPALRRQVLVSLVTSVVPAVTLLSVGVALGGPWQRPIWLLAVLYDLAIIFLTSRGGGGWVIRSAAHFAERHAGVVILALGESIVAIAVGVAQRPLSWPIIAATVLALAIVGGLWSSYFDRVAGLLEDGLASLSGQPRARMGRDLFTYLHFPVVFGVILAALGIEQAMAYLDAGRIGPTGAFALGVGLAVSLTGAFGAAWRAAGVRLPWRLAAVVLLLGLAAFGGGWHPLAALGVAAGVLLLLALVESRVPVAQS